MLHLILRHPFFYKRILYKINAIDFIIVEMTFLCFFLIFSVKILA